MSSQLAKMLESGQRAAARICAGKRVHIMYDTDGAAYTSPKEPGVIHLPPLPSDISEEAVDLLRGLVDHESGHVNDTDMKVYEKLRIPAGGVVHTFANGIEDGRIDRMMSEKALGIGRNLDFLRRNYLYKEDIIKGIIEKKDLDEVTKGLLLLNIRMNYYNDEFDDFIHDRCSEHEMYNEFIGLVAADIERCKRVRSTVDSVKLAESMATTLKDYLTETKVPPQDGDGEGDGEGEDGEEGEEQKEKGKGKGKGKGKASVSKGEDGEEETEDGESGEGEGEDEDEDEEEGDDEGAGKGEGEDEDEDDGEGEDEEDGDDGEGEGKSKDGEEKAKGNDNDDVEEIDAREELKGDGGKEKNAKAKAEDIEEKMRTATQSTGENGAAVTPEKAILGKVSKLIITDIDRSGKHGLPLIPYQDGDIELDMFAEKDKGKLEQVGYCDDNLKSGFDRYVTNCQQLRGDINVLRRRLLIDLLGNPKRWTKRQKKGVLNDRDIHRVAFKDEDLFKRKRRKIEVDAAVTLFVDCSGSMNGSKIETAADVAIILSETLHLVGVPFEVLGYTQIGRYALGDDDVTPVSYSDGYTRVDPLLHYVFKPFERKMCRKTKALIGNIPNILLWENIDGEHLRWAAQRLAARKESKKLMIVISDGCPVGNARYNTREDLKTVCKMIEQSGELNLFGIGVQYAKVKEYYRDWANVDNVSELVKTAYTKIAGFLKGVKSVRRAGM